MQDLNTKMAAVPDGTECLPAMVDRLGTILNRLADRLEAVRERTSESADPHGSVPLPIPIPPRPSASKDASTTPTAAECRLSDGLEAIAPGGVAVSRSDNFEVVPDEDIAGSFGDLGSLDDIVLTPVASAEPMDTMLASDQLTLTPVAAPSASAPPPMTPVKSEDVRVIEENIGLKFQQLSESFMYLGVLQNMPLPSAMQLFERKVENIAHLAEDVWQGQALPAPAELFARLDEDYDRIQNLVHANEALNPICDGLQQVYSDLERLRDLGLSLERARQTLESANANK